MSGVPDAWADEWSTVADAPTSSLSAEQPKKVSAKVSKAQKRAQQAEFNRQLWAEAEGPKETNYFLESRNVVPLREEFKPPPILLSRKGPIIKSSRPPPTGGINDLTIKNESSEDEDEVKTQAKLLAQRQAQATKDREEKQRKYEERRLELFGPQNAARPSSRSGNSSPGSGTPPHSRSATPNRGGNKRGRGRGNYAVNNQPRTQQSQVGKELYDGAYAAKPDSTYIQRREQGSSTPRQDGVQPMRAPKGPDGTPGFNFANRRKDLDQTMKTTSIETS